MTKVDHTKLKATPEQEDFHHKYTEEGSGLVGSKLLDGYFKAVKSLVDEANLKKGKALEIGCGAGFSTKRLNKMLPSGVELEASEYVEQLLPDARKLNPGMKITAESVYELKREDKSLDLVFLLEVLEHLDYPDTALKEISRAVKPGGYLILGVPREPLWRTLNMARLKYVRNLGNTTGHLNHWSKRSLVKHVSENFHEVIEVRSPLPWTLVLARKPIDHE
ncbi:hypothetical protein A3F64_03210 [Candidatus Saccharibacteria bacterium RIFCSPHIGHO2_12_FULL_42_8]|nr:MAG: hypothetical protein A3F64_03210 [Candidatus Saccharibacteria bacterium RIFCSPHIGHO2_12_FULL_42_8]